MDSSTSIRTSTEPGDSRASGASTERRTDAGRKGSRLPWREVGSGAFVLALIAFSILANQQIYAAHQESGGQLTHEVMGPMPSALLSMAEFMAPLVGTIIDDHGILAVIQAMEVVHWILLVVGAGLLVLPSLLLRRPSAELASQ